LQNPRKALVTYLFLLHEINFAKFCFEAYSLLERVFTLHPPLASWFSWREERFSAEINWWTWHLDYWMENGLLRDVFTHELTTLDHFAKLRKPEIYTEAELRMYQAALKNVEPTYDPRCVNDVGDCRPAAVATEEKITSPLTGPQEISKFASVIENKPGVDVIEEPWRQCVWEKVAVEKAHQARYEEDRAGPSMESYVYTKDQVQVIINELYRVRDKYNSGEWLSNPVAQDVVAYLNEYIEENEQFLSTME